MFAINHKILFPLSFCPLWSEHKQHAFILIYLTAFTQFLPFLHSQRTIKFNLKINIVLKIVCVCTFNVNRITFISIQKKELWRRIYNTVFILYVYGRRNKQMQFANLLWHRTHELQTVAIVIVGYAYMKE